jgi:hypothetical protein
MRFGVAVFAGRKNGRYERYNGASALGENVGAPHRDYESSRPFSEAQMVEQAIAVDAPHRFWRWVFWGVVIHFVQLGLVAWMSWIPEALEHPTLGAFHPKHLGFANAVSLWLYLNSFWVWCALLSADAAAL